MSSRQFVVIMTDTQRQDMVGCYGNPGMRTPALERLAQQGVRFDRAYTCQPVCGPGALPLHWHLPHTNGCGANSNPLVAINIKTVGQRLHDQGSVPPLQSANGTLTAATTSAWVVAPTAGIPTTGTTCATTWRS